MKLRLLLIGMAVVIGASVLFIYRTSTAQPEMTEEQRMMHEFMGIEYIDGKAVRVRPPKIEKYPEPPDPYEGMSAAQKADFILQRQKHMADVSRALYRDLDHYFKVVDQDHQPLAGVKVFVNASGFTFLGPLVTGYSKRTIELVSDANGMAHVQARDVDFAARFVKEGYIFSSGSGNLNEEHIVATAVDKPEIVRAFKLPPAEVMAQSEAERGGGGLYHFVPDGRAVGISLERNKLYPGEQPDLLLRMTRRLSPPLVRNEPMDWEATIEIPQGGLIETREEYMFEAPESGYQQTWTIKRNQVYSERVERNREDKKFYIKARNGQLYAAVEVTLSPTYGHDVTEATAEFTVVINAQGSRNLYKK